MTDYEDPTSEGNHAKHHTGCPCIMPGCGKPAGTAWSALWCFKHNISRMKQIEAAYQKVQEQIARGIA